jgi:hypothetical protein
MLVVVLVLMPLLLLQKWRHELLHLLLLEDEEEPTKPKQCHWYEHVISIMTMVWTVDVIPIQLNVYAIPQSVVFHHSITQANHLSIIIMPESDKKRKRKKKKKERKEGILLEDHHVLIQTNEVLQMMLPMMV